MDKETNKWQRKPVEYNGITFKSTLEGRIANLLDLLGAKWEYEPMQENGYMVDFVVHDVYLPWGFSDLFIEAKQLMSPPKTAVKSDSQKILDFALDKCNSTIIVSYLQKQYLTDWATFREHIEELSNTPLKGYNPENLCPYNFLMVDTTTSAAALAVTKNGDIVLTDFYHYQTIIDEDKTLKAYYSAFSRIFEDTTERLKDQIKWQEKMIYKYEREKETKSVHKQILIRPSLDEKLHGKAQLLGIKVNELINRILEDNLYGDY